MNKAIPWNIKGIGFDTREAARLAAKRAGIPVGEWLEQVISEQAGQGDRTSTVAERDEDPGSFPSDSLRRSLTSSTIASRPSEPSALLDRHGSTIEEDSSAMDETFRKLEDRLTSLANMLDANNPDERTEAERLEVGARARSSQAGIGYSADRVLPAPAPVVVSRGSVGAIVQRQQSLDADAPPRTAVLRQTSPSRPRASDKDVRHADILKDLVPETPRALASVGRLDQVIRSQKSENQLFQDGFSELSQDIASLAKHLRTVEGDTARRKEQGQVVERLESLRGEIASLSKDVGNLKTEPTISSLETAVRDLAGRVESSRLDGVQNSVLAPVERLSAEIREAIGAIDSRAIVQGLDRQLKLLSRKIETMTQRGADADALAIVQDQTREVREALKAAALTPSVGDRIEEELSKLGARVDRVADMPPRAAYRDLERSVGEIRTLLEDFNTKPFLAKLDKSLDRLAEKIDKAAERHAPNAEMLGDLTRRIDAGYASIEARLDRRAKEPSTEMAALETMLGTLTRQVEDIRSSSSEVKNLDGLVRGLMTRIDDARQPDADDKIIDALETQVSRLAERLDRSEASLGLISNVQSSISDLVQQLQETRESAVDVAETAARTAAEDALRAALASPSLGRNKDRGSDHFIQELSEIRRSQEAADKRVNSTLNALGSTLDRLVDHLAKRVEVEPALKAASISLPRVDEEAAPARRAGERQARVPEAPKGFSRRTESVPASQPVSDDLDGPIPRRAVPPVEINDVEADGAPDVSPLIAAARRAALAAQKSAATMQQTRRPASGGREPAAKGQGFLAQRRRPLLLGLASIVLLLGALQIVKLSTANSAQAPVALEQQDRTNSIALNAPAKRIPSTNLASGDSVTTSTAPSRSADADIAKTAMDAPAPAAVASDPTLGALPTGLRDLALKGDAAAQYEVALRFADGRGVTRDPKTAATWFERAAKQGSAPAQYRLASMYEKGIGVAADKASAIAWYDRASTGGNIRAMHNLAVMLAEGADGKPDYAKASSWFSKAANYGVRDSQYNLAILFARGLGTSQSLSQSYTWFAIAANQGDTDATRKRDEVAAKLDAKTLADAKAAADGFKPMVSDKAANDVAPPPGGWDAVAPAKSVPGTAWREVRPTSFYG